MIKNKLRGGTCRCDLTKVEEDALKILLYCKGCGLFWCGFILV